MKKWLLALISIVGAYAVFSGEFLIEGKGLLFAFIREGLSSNNETNYLREKNQELEIEVLNLKNGNPSLSGVAGVPAKVFSAYPFADRSELTISAGSAMGVEIGNAVIYGNVLVGKIKEISKRTSVVQTVFDPKFEIPVRIGEAETDALYVGSMNPKLNMIDTNKSPKCGELVICAAKDLPYGLGVGRTLEISDGLFKEASLEPLLEIKELRNVFVVTN
ncbi:MAG: rod shape-determining protein MreC [Parcubacteria group bacterium]